MWKDTYHRGFLGSSRMIRFRPTRAFPDRLDAYSLLAPLPNPTLFSMPWTNRTTFERTSDNPGHLHRRFAIHLHAIFWETQLLLSPFKWTFGQRGKWTEDEYDGESKFAEMLWWHAKRSRHIRTLFDFQGELSDNNFHPTSSKGWNFFNRLTYRIDGLQIDTVATGGVVFKVKHLTA